MHVRKAEQDGGHNQRTTGPLEIVHEQVPRTPACTAQIPCLIRVKEQLGAGFQCGDLLYGQTVQGWGDVADVGLTCMSCRSFLANTIRPVALPQF